jgi:hypothetical protein
MEVAALFVIAVVVAYWLGRARALSAAHRDAKRREFRLKRVSQAELWKN